MATYIPATHVRENIVIGAMETKIAKGQSVFILAAMDEFSRFAIAFEVVFVNSSATWSAFIRQKVLADKHVSTHKDSITFFLGCDPENVGLTAEDLPSNHKWVADDGRCYEVLKEFFDGLVDSVSSSKR
ncbi:MAG: hypothetical protein RL204_662 [Bacteroidota bacterium]|jgi:hypothetical protein